MSTSRQQILDYIRSHNSVTPRELSQALHMTQANVRHHIGILISRGLVESTCRQPPQGRGRPARFFQPSKESLGNNLDILSGILLQESCPTFSKEAEEAFLKRLAENLALYIYSGSGLKTIKPSPSGEIQNHKESEKYPELSFTQRLNRSIRDLNQLHYQARWEAHKEGPLLIFWHCPYFSIMPEHPELCQMDKYLLEMLIQSRVEPISKLVKDKWGNTACNFRILA